MQLFLIGAMCMHIDTHGSEKNGNFIDLFQVQCWGFSQFLQFYVQCLLVICIVLFGFPTTEILGIKESLFVCHSHIRWNLPICILPCRSKTENVFDYRCTIQTHDSAMWPRYRRCIQCSAGRAPRHDGADHWPRNQNQARVCTHTNTIQRNCRKRAISMHSLSFFSDSMPTADAYMMRHRVCLDLGKTVWHQLHKIIPRQGNQWQHRVWWTRRMIVGDTLIFGDRIRFRLIIRRAYRKASIHCGITAARHTTCNREHHTVLVELVFVVFSKANQTSIEMAMIGINLRVQQIDEKYR